MLKIQCKDKWRKAKEASREHYDKTFDACFSRLLARSTNENVKEVIVTSEHGEHCFFFREVYENGGTGICGGIIFHGFPDSGYKENGSVMLSPSFGWSIHT